jgi:CheY-like chemotaxis protein/anti-sigma regulatory factor (Ser/Thr protein kinase)
MPRILLVDDEKAVKWALQEALTDAGYEVETATSGEEGLLKAREQAFDLVVTDLRMPGISGLDMIREMKKSRPDLRAIICSAYGSMESVVEAMRLGVNDFLVKPFKIAELKKSIADLLGPPAESASPPAAVAKPPTAAPERPAAAPEASAPVSHAAVAMVEMLTLPSLPYAVAGLAVSPGRPKFSDGVFFDVVEDSGRHLVLFGSSPVIGDEACALSQLLRGIFRCQVQHVLDPEIAVRSLNETLWKSFSPRPAISLFYGLIDPKMQELEYVCTGDRIMGALRRAEGRDEPLRVESTTLGHFPGVMVTERKVALRPEDRLILLSSARTEYLPQLPDVEEYFIQEVMPETNWQDGRELALQIQTRAAALSSTQDPMGLIVIVVEQPSESHSATRRKVCLNSREQNLQVLLAELGWLGQEARASTDLMHDITAAVIEAVNNAQVHAYPEEGPITVRMTLSNGEIVIEVCDEGVGFDKKGYRAPDFHGYEGLTRDQGRGIYLIQQLMDRTLIDSRPNQGTIVHMAKRLAKA